MLLTGWAPVASVKELFSSEAGISGDSWGMDMVIFWGVSRAVNCWKCEEVRGRTATISATCGVKVYLVELERHREGFRFVDERAEP